MKQPIIKIMQLDIENFKNVERGIVDVSREEDIRNCESSILGVYGQNGSGKTSLIEVVSLIKMLFSGQSLPDNIADLITAESQFMKIQILFYIKQQEEKNPDYKVKYIVHLERDNVTKTREGIDSLEYLEAEEIPNVFIKDEKLEYWVSDKEKSVWERLKTLIRFSEGDVSPKYREEEVLSNVDKEYFFDLLIDKMSEQKKSFIFSSDLRKVLFKEDKSSELNIIEFLRAYMMKNLFIVKNNELSLSSANIVLPLNIRNYIKNEKNEAQVKSSGVVPISLLRESKLPATLYEEIVKSIDNSNIVLGALIPSFKIETEIVKRIKEDEGEEIVIFASYSVKNGNRILLKYESDGIKKIVAIIHLLIAMYNHENITVLIDELDSGVFEYLLGELLEILEQRGKGQLIFTSHNLRPLEILNKNNLIFTTTNPSNRFIRFKNVKTNNNLRDFYYRDINLETQEEATYDKTSQINMGIAFRKAGEYHGKK